VTVNHCEITQFPSESVFKSHEAVKFLHRSRLELQNQLVFHRDRAFIVPQVSRRNIAFTLIGEGSEFLNGEIFYSLQETQILTEKWRVEYNTERPHSALGYRPPAPQAILPKQQGHGDMENAPRFPHPHTPGGYDGQNV
jgi:Integrase core domain